jgi:hypothetical protein
MGLTHDQGLDGAIGDETLNDRGKVVFLQLTIHQCEPLELGLAAVQNVAYGHGRPSVQMLLHRELGQGGVILAMARTSGPIIVFESMPRRSNSRIRLFDIARPIRWIKWPVEILSFSKKEQSRRCSTWMLEEDKAIWNGAAAVAVTPTRCNVRTWGLIIFQQQVHIGDDSMVERPYK